jgi:hypothetical protein
VLAAIDDEKQQAYRRYDASRGEWWQLFRNLRARITYGGELAGITASRLWNPVWWRTHKRKQNLRALRAADRRRYRTDYRSSLQRQIAQTNAAETRYETAMQSIRADRSAARRNTVDNFKHAANEVFRFQVAHRGAEFVLRNTARVAGFGAGLKAAFT